MIPEKCEHDDCLRDGPRPGCWSYKDIHVINIEMGNQVICDLCDAVKLERNRCAEILDAYACACCSACCEYDHLDSIKEKILNPEIPKEERLPCLHGRESWHSCPHCLGVNG